MVSYPDTDIDPALPMVRYKENGSECLPCFFRRS